MYRREIKLRLANNCTISLVVIFFFVIIVINQENFDYSCSGTYIATAAQAFKTHCKGLKAEVLPEFGRITTLLGRVMTIQIIWSGRSIPEVSINHQGTPL